jgi:2-keto-4-pentenoate hydratase/2-oxohepta-3-ene-1,7-dioic acid hydratase in catechol pathway
MALGLGICKGKDFAHTLGPWIVTPDELEPYRKNDRFELALEAKINGCLLELWGRFGRDCHPPLTPGDTVELNVQGIGTLTNRVTAGVQPVPLPTARRVNYMTER